MKIFLPTEFRNPLLWHKLHTLIFDVEPEFSFTADITQADLVVALWRWENKESVVDYLYSFKYKGPILLLSIFHTSAGLLHDSNDELVLYFKQYFSDCTVVHTNTAEKDAHIFYDMWWQMHKIYFNEYHRHNLDNRVWTYNSTDKMFKLKPIGLNTRKSIKHFLCPIRLYDNISCDFRPRLNKILSDYDNGYRSRLDQGHFLKPQELNEVINNRFNDKNGNYGAGTWYPIHNKYYQTSIASIYGETLSETIDPGAVTGVTEKTLTPLIKGHFIIPFAYTGFINKLKSVYNVKFPDWIDYSYDSILDNEERKLAYFESIKQFLNRDISELITLYNKDIEILRHNRNLFFSVPRETVYHKIKDFVEGRL